MRLPTSGIAGFYLLASHGHVTGLATGTQAGGIWNSLQNRETWRELSPGYDFHILASIIESLQVATSNQQSLNPSNLHCFARNLLLPRWGGPFVGDWLAMSGNKVSGFSWRIFCSKLLWGWNIWHMNPFWRICFGLSWVITLPKTNIISPWKSMVARWNIHLRWAWMVLRIPASDVGGRLTC